MVNVKSTLYRGVNFNSELALETLFSSIHLLWSWRKGTSATLIWGFMIDDAHIMIFMRLPRKNARGEADDMQAIMPFTISHKFAWPLVCKTIAQYKNWNMRTTSDNHHGEKHYLHDVKVRKFECSRRSSWRSFLNDVQDSHWWFVAWCHSLLRLT